jgi:poly-D-alanine transfer protein DltD
VRGSFKLESTHQPARPGTSLPYHSQGEAGMRNLLNTMKNRINDPRVLNPVSTPAGSTQAQTILAHASRGKSANRYSNYLQNDPSVRFNQTVKNSPKNVESSTLSPTINIEGKPSGNNEGIQVKQFTFESESNQVERSRRNHRRRILRMSSDDGKN